MQEQVLRDVLRNGGIATGGTNTTLVDTTKYWIVNAYAGVAVKILIGGIEYNTTIASNTATQLTFAALPVGIVVVAGCSFFFPLDLATLSAIVAIAVEDLLDGVYFNEVLGVAGTAWPIGTPGNPVNNLADALTIMAARDYQKLYLAGAGAHAITFGVNVDLELVGNPAYAITVGAGVTATFRSDLICASITNTSTGAFTVKGTLTVIGNLTTNSVAGATIINNDCYIGGVLTTGTSATLTIYGNTYIYDMAHASSGAIFIGGNLEMPTGILSNGGGNITVDGDVSIGTNWNNGGGGNCLVTGKVFIAGTLSMDGADTWASGNLHAGVITNTSSGTFKVHGTLDVDGAVTNTTGNSTIDGNTHIGNLLSTTTGHILIFGNLHVGTTITVSGPSGDLTVYGNLFCGDDFTTQDATATITVVGNVQGGDGYIGTAGTLTIGGNCFLADDIANVAAAVNIGGKLETGDDLTTTTGAITVGGDTHVGGLLDITDTGDIKIQGNLYVGETTRVTTNGGLLHVYGDAELIGAVTTSVIGAVITIDGIGRIYGVITNTGTLTYKPAEGSILHELADVPFSVNAALAEVNVFDLSVANTRYVVRSLRLKCADPGANTVTVRLYELVNNVPTLVATFAISATNFTTHHSLMDMFGLPELAGDNLKVTVIATAAGPFVVTGQYCTATATI
jgi:hypothetical protein